MFTNVGRTSSIFRIDGLNDEAFRKRKADRWLFTTREQFEPGVEGRKVARKRVGWSRAGSKERI